MVWIDRSNGSKETWWFQSRFHSRLTRLSFYKMWKMVLLQVSIWYLKRMKTFRGTAAGQIAIIFAKNLFIEMNEIWYSAFKFSRSRSWAFKYTSSQHLFCPAYKFEMLRVLNSKFHRSNLRVASAALQVSRLQQHNREKDTQHETDPLTLRLKSGCTLTNPLRPKGFFQESQNPNCSRKLMKKHFETLSWPHWALQMVRKH